MITRPLKRVADVRFSSVDKKAVDGQVPVRLCNYTDVYYNDRIVADMTFMDATATSDQVAQFSLRAGDVLLTKDSETADDIGVSAYVAEDLPGVLCGYHLAVVRPRAGSAVGRYLHWALTASSSRSQLEVAATGVTRFGLRREAVAGMLLPIPNLAEQRAIAEYLDDEAARIDALITARSRQLELLAERLRALRDHELERHSAEQRRVSHLLLTPISDGPHETPEFVDEGIPFLSVDNIVDDRLSFAGCRRISPEAHLRYARKSSPRRGDVLVTKAAAVGRVGLVETDEAFSVWSPLAILRPDPKVVLPEYLRMTLLGTHAQSLMHLAATSNTQQNISMRDLAAIRLPIPSLADQAEAIRSFEADAALIAVARSALSRQLGLLHERRQAVIDAVVSGQLDISGVAA